MGKLDLRDHVCPLQLILPLYGNQRCLLATTNATNKQRPSIMFLPTLVWQSVVGLGQVFWSP